MLLELKNVSKSYGENKVLDRVSLCLDRGKSVAVVAPSGTGKSTLLSIAGLLLTPNGGDVLFDGVSTACLTDNERSRLRAEKIGFLFQHTQAVGTLRAWENVSIGLDFLSQDVGRKEAERMAQDLLTSFGLEDRMFHYPHQAFSWAKASCGNRASLGGKSLAHHCG